MKRLKFATVCILSFLIDGCCTGYAWRADGFGVSVSSTSISIVYGEVNRIPPGGYFSHTRSVDLRPFWKRFFFDPGTNSLAQATVIIDARNVKPECECCKRGDFVKQESVHEPTRPCVTNEMFILPERILNGDYTNNVMLCSEIVQRETSVR